MFSFAPIPHYELKFIYIMIRWASFFIITAIICAILGYGELLGTSSIIAKSSFFIFIALYIISLLKTGINRYEKPYEQS